ncbi:MAG: hypothetical protein IPL58_01215 [Betaproteobacteria bacterium]|uniref:Uncharacterized protein n=1 Tax=Candidatus Proximibacter danicus TaxID=2954365 RepID=A0A9D7K1N2_9PROT|nr:hypothetical protein [Candidatus Proximibacter danicus]
MARRVFDLDADAATRHELGFFTQKRLPLASTSLGLSDAEDFLADGFGAVGSQNSGLGTISASALAERITSEQRLLGAGAASFPDVVASRRFVLGEGGYCRTVCGC